jgi:hypothetical protein
MRTVSMKENIHLHVYTIVLFVLLVGVRVWEKRSKTVSKRPLPRLLGSVLLFFSCLIGVSEFEPYTRFHIFTKNPASNRALPMKTTFQNGQSLSPSLPVVSGYRFLPTRPLLLSPPRRAVSSRVARSKVTRESFMAPHYGTAHVDEVRISLALLDRLPRTSRRIHLKGGYVEFSAEDPPPDARLARPPYPLIACTRSLHVPSTVLMSTSVD